MAFRREYQEKILEIARNFKIRLMTEEELPLHRKNVIKCEDKGSAFAKLKKR